MSETSVIAAHLTGARPRVIAALTHYFRDIDLAQDGFQEASAKALKHWPSDGIPTNTVAWLTVAARNSVLDELRRSRRQGDLLEKYAPFDTSIENPEDDILKLLDENVLRDDILRLLFMCSHPELTPTDQIALALKVVGGLSVAQIARAFLLHAKTMEQRITRAKKKAAAAATELDVPTAIERSKRLNSVCTMVYLMFNEGYSVQSGNIPISARLCEEAIRLARLLLSLFPSQPEIMGLLALFLFQHSRQDARTNMAGDLVSLEQQDRSIWNTRHINEAHVLLEKALRIGAAGSYQIQAAIAGVHCMAKSADETDWSEIAQHYEALSLIMPSPVITLNRAVAVSKAQSPEKALALLSEAENDLSGYLYFHVAKADFLQQLGRLDEAKKSYQTALACGPNDAEHKLILEKIEKTSN